MSIVNDTSFSFNKQLFIMIDEQRVVYEEIIKLSMRCQKDHK